MSPYLSAAIAMYALIFAVYQYKITRGQLRADIRGMQKDLNVGVTSRAPNPVSVDGLLIICDTVVFGRLHVLVGRKPAVPRRWASIDTIACLTLRFSVSTFT